MSTRAEILSGVLTLDPATGTVRADPRPGRLLLELVGSAERPGREAAHLDRPQERQGGAEPLPLRERRRPGAPRQRPRPRPPPLLQVLRGQVLLLVPGARRVPRRRGSAQSERVDQPARRLRRRQVRRGHGRPRPARHPTQSRRPPPDALRPQPAPPSARPRRHPAHRPGPPVRHAGLHGQLSVRSGRQDQE